MYIVKPNFGNRYIAKNPQHTSLYFKGIDPSTLDVYREGNNLIIQQLNSKNKLTIRDEFFDDIEKNETTVSTIKSITFDSGLTWNANQIKQRAVIGTNEEDEIHGFLDNDVMYGRDGDDILYGDGGNNVLYGGSGNDALYGGFFGTNALYGESGDDYLNGHGFLYGGIGNDTLVGTGELYGGDGNDHLTLLPLRVNDDKKESTELGLAKKNDYINLGPAILDGGAGDDIIDLSQYPYQLTDAGIAWSLTPHKGEYEHKIIGGTGNDTIYGSFSNELYVFNLGDGHDTIIKCKPENAKNNVAVSFDVIEFGKGIDPTDIFLYGRTGDDLTMYHSNNQDSITVKDYFNTTSTAPNHFKIDELRFADGTKISSAEFENWVYWTGTSADDTMIGYRDANETISAGDGNDTVFGGAGNDSISGGAGNDYLSGDDGDDFITGNEGNDIIYGGRGNDILDGGEGDDKYVYRLGDGQDVIDQTGGGTDTLSFDIGITKERLTFSKDSNDLLILIDQDAQQSVRVKDHFLGGEKAIALVQLENGYAMTATDIAKQLNVSDDTHTPIDPNHLPSKTDFESVIIGKETIGDELIGTKKKDFIQGLSGDDELYGFEGDDYLDGGDGNDYLSGGNGMHQNSGNDILIGGAGDDVLIGEDGDDLLIGGTGNDSYLYSENDGVDTIDNTGGGNDGIFFQKIDSGRLSYHQDKNDLVILVDRDLKQQVRVKDHFLGGDKSISYIQPEDGYAILSESIPKLLTQLPDDRVTSQNLVVGTAGKDKLYGTKNADLIQGLAGNDKLYGLAGNDYLDGGNGDDELYGGDGNDTLEGGAGNDELVGGQGDDTYLFNPHFGQDKIDNKGGGNDQIYFNGLNYNDVTFGASKNDLVIKVKNSTDQVTVKNWMKGGENVVPTVKFSSGVQFSSDQIFKALGRENPTATNNLNAMKSAMAGMDNQGGTSSGLNTPQDQQTSTSLFIPT